MAGPEGALRVGIDSWHARDDHGGLYLQPRAIPDDYRYLLYTKPEVKEDEVAPRELSTFGRANMMRIAWHYGHVEHRNPMSDDDRELLSKVGRTARILISSGIPFSGHSGALSVNVRRFTILEDEDTPSVIYVPINPAALRSKVAREQFRR